ncbi:hypothetical protein ACFQGT_02585 [Natrialbaceae archaeon GCM10025810]|uniref:hypothetical protein n=1 Tax=Halovalidus salilacus TaxID=3075124 RepID=UPI00360EEF8D
MGKNEKHIGRRAALKGIYGGIITAPAINLASNSSKADDARDLRYDAFGTDIVKTDTGETVADIRSVATGVDKIENTITSFTQSIIAGMDVYDDSSTSSISWGEIRDIKLEVGKKSIPSNASINFRNAEKISKGNDTTADKVIQAGLEILAEEAWDLPGPNPFEAVVSEDSDVSTRNFNQEIVGNFADLNNEDMIYGATWSMYFEPTEDGTVPTGTYEFEATLTAEVGRKINNQSAGTYHHLEDISQTHDIVVEVVSS